MGVRQVAICGLAPSYQLAPWHDPEWETWVLAWGHEFIHVADKVFEIHDPYCFGEGYEDHLAEIDNLITQKEYPLEEIINQFRDYFMSSGDFMLALAAYELEKGDQVAMYGINASDPCGDRDMARGYSHQRPSMEYWMGVVEGVTGNKIILPDDCPLLKFVKPDFLHEKWINRYGYC